MLEKILDAIVTAETYTIRVADEGIHNLIDKTLTNYVERKGIPRNVVAAVLTGISGISILVMTGVNDLKELFTLYSAKYNAAKEDLAFLSSITRLMLISAYARIDINNLPKRNTQQSDGTMTEDGLFSHQSFTGIIRPYVLLGSIGLIARGISASDTDALKYGSSLAAYALSLYIRDSQSGGLLNKIGEGVKSLFKSPAVQGSSAYVAHDNKISTSVF